MLPLPSIPKMENMCRTYILGQRIAQAIACIIALQFIFLFTMLIPLNLSLSQPETWLRSAISIVTVGTLYLFPFALVLCAECLVFSEYLETDNTYFTSRFSIVSSIFKARHFLMSLFHTLIGGFIFYLYVSVIGGGYGQLTKECEGIACIVESHLYLILCGAWTGFFFYFRIIVFQSKYLIFPVIRQSKLRQIKSELKPLFIRAIFDTFWPTFIFGAIYYWKGDGIREQTCNVFYLKFDDTPITNGLMNVSLLMYSWFLSTLFVFTLFIVKLILQVYLMAPKTFPISTSDPKGIALHQSLDLHKLRIVQYLAYRDLLYLAEKDPKRREELFSLSQPGGHPYNWNALVAVCLKLLNSFTTDLNKVIIESSDGLKTFAKPGVEPVTPAHKQPHGLRNLIPPRIDARPGSASVEHQQQPIPSAVGKKITSAYLQQAVLKNPAINFLFGELPEVKVRSVFSNCELVTLACQSLALLASASFHEDKYGVVQKDLAAIITSLLQLKQVLDKLQKIGNYKKVQRSEHYEVKLKHTLRSAVKRGLYRITVSFGNYLKELPLSTEALQQIPNFLLCKE